MLKLATATLLAILAVTNVNAAEKALTASECSVLWQSYKASADYKDPGKGNRMGAWQDFRKAKCGKDRDNTAAKAD